MTDRIKLRLAIITLRVIHTWASYMLDHPNKRTLDPHETRSLIEKTLLEIGEPVK